MNSQTNEERTRYWDGVLHGAILGVSRYRPGDREFDHEKWRDLYGSRIVHSSVSSYPPDAESESDAGPLLVTWDDEVEENYLKDGAEPLRDRNGSMVFEGGIVVRMFRNDDPIMFSIAETDVEFFERLSKKRLEVIRECYGYE